MRLRLVHLDIQLPQLLRVDLAGAPVIRSVARCVLGKAMQSRMLSSPPKSITTRSMPRAMPPCGGAPNCKASEQEAESLAGRLLVDAQQAEHLLLELLVVDTNRAAAGLVAVDHQVVGLRPGTCRDRSPAARGPAAAATVNGWCMAAQPPLFRRRRRTWETRRSRRSSSSSGS